MIYSICLFLSSFTLCNVFQVYPCCCKWQNFTPLRLSDIPLYVYVSHIFVHSSVDRYIGCFHILAIVNNASMNIGVHVSFCINVFGLGGVIYQGVEFLDHRVVLSLLVFWFFFWEISILFSTVAVPIYIGAKNVRGFPFLHILANICYLCSYWWLPSWQVCGDIPLWFWFVLPPRLATLSIFPCAFWPSAFPPWKNVYVSSSVWLLFIF